MKLLKVLRQKQLPTYTTKNKLVSKSKLARVRDNSAFHILYEQIICFQLLSL